MATDNRVILAGDVFDGSDPNNKTLESAKCHLENNLIGDALMVDSMTAVVRDYSPQSRLVAADGMLAGADGMLVGAVYSKERLDKTLHYGDLALCYHENTLVGKFRVETIKRVSQYGWQVEGISDLGLLETSYHYGGIYTGQTLGEVLGDIVNGIIPYTLDSTFAAVQVYGLLRKQTRRNNLRDLLFAYGGALSKAADGTLVISPLTEKTAVNVDLERWYQSGNIADETPATRLEVTEHAYYTLPDNTEVVLYEGESAAEKIVTPKGAIVEGILVEFQEPMHDLVAENVSLLEQGANYAVLSGSPSAKLTGQQYSHTERVLVRQSNDGGVPNVVVTNTCTLVNLINAENVADRLWSYYTSVKTVKGSFTLGNERPGDNICFSDMFGEDTEGYVSAMDMTLSATVKVDSTIVANYTPGGSGNFYTQVAIISVDETWVAPDTVKGKIRVVLISGGQGGFPGEAGSDGQKGNNESNGQSGKGGEGGQPGSSGRISVVTLAAQKGETFSAHIGKGGEGGQPGGVPKDGGETTFGGYSSNDGYVAKSGYQDLLNGTLYATPSNPGIAGGDGGSENERPTVVLDGHTWTAGKMGASAHSGAVTGYGGFGGGAAVGADGNDGGDGEAKKQSDGTRFADGGPGGDGASVTKKADNAIVRGSGGNGGHGGGGGGGGGGFVADSSSGWRGDPGKGGRPGAGGDGADGLILIYY